MCSREEELTSAERSPLFAEQSQTSQLNSFSSVADIHLSGERRFSQNTIRSLQSQQFDSGALLCSLKDRDDDDGNECHGNNAADNEEVTLRVSVRKQQLARLLQELQRRDGGALSRTVTAARLD